MTGLAALPIILTVAATAFQTIGALQTAEAQDDLGKHAQRIAQRDKEAAFQQAGQERALSQRDAIKERQQGEFVSSRVQALSAASGGGALDPTIINILAGVQQTEDFNAAMALATGESRARALEFGGTQALARGEGEQTAFENAARASRFQAAGSLLEGGSSLFAKYGPSGRTIDPGSFTRPTIVAGGRFAGQAGR